MIKEFNPYYNLWTTSAKWYKHIENWRYGPWNSLNADECEKFMEESVRTFN